MARHRAKFGRLGGLTAALDGESQLERRWRKGADGEARIGKRLERSVERAGVIVLHDLRVPGSRANIDHVCVGDGTITVIDAKNYRGKVRVRQGRLWVGGRDRTGLVEGVERQVDVVRSVLSPGLTADIVGAIAFADGDRLPLFGRLRVRGVRIDGVRQVAKLAKRRGPRDGASRELLEAIIRARLSR